MARDIDIIVERLRDRFPDLVVRQIHVNYPNADDDGVWNLWLPGRENRDVQLESSSGMCPFIIEHNEMRSSLDAWRADSIADAVERVSAYLMSVKRCETIG